jgi:hypothetical protein
MLDLFLFVRVLFLIMTNKQKVGVFLSSSGSARAMLNDFDGAYKVNQTNSSLFSLLITSVVFLFVLYDCRSVDQTANRVLVDEMIKRAARSPQTVYYALHASYIIDKNSILQSV